MKNWEMNADDLAAFAINVESFYIRAMRLRRSRNADWDSFADDVIEAYRAANPNHPIACSAHELAITLQGSF